MSLRVAVLASGGGSNLQALIDRFAGSDDVEIVLVVSDRPTAGALERARAAGIAALHLAARDEAALLAALRESGSDLIALAGYLRLIPAPVVQQYRGRIINIHPALLPAFGGAGMYGLNVHAAVLRAGCTVSGATVHLVDERYDEGRIIAQWPVPVHADDTPESLAARVLRIEHRLYPAVLAAISGRHNAGRAALSPEVFRYGSADGIDEDMTAAIRMELNPDAQGTT